MDYDGFKWITMDYDGFKWITMDYDGFKWISMDYDGLKWISHAIHHCRSHVYVPMLTPSASLTLNLAGV